MESNAVGPGAVPVVGEAPKPVLEGASELEYVEVHNPLPMDFIAQVAMTRPVNAPVRIVQTPGLETVVQNESDLARVYGLAGFKNADHTGKANIINQVVLPAGKTVRLLGNVAQVVVNQLVNEIMQRNKQQLLLADPHARHEVEVLVVQRRGSVSEYMNSTPLTVAQQAQVAIEESNEQEFPGLVGDGEASSESGSQTEPVGDVERRKPGRPAKSQ